MKTFPIYLILSLFLFTSCKLKKAKVDICHHDASTNTWKTINISKSAVTAHLNHGDVQGDCSNLKTYIPDDAFEFALIQWGYDDVMDDYVSNSNINTIESLSFDEACCSIPWVSYHDPVTGDGPYPDGVSDFTGIEGFTQLKNLFINGHNEITNLDLSQNLALETISLVQIDRNLETIDLSNNIALKSFSLQESINLKYFDLTQNVALNRIYLEYSPGLIKINLKNGNNTLITSFYSIGNSNLNCIQVDNAIYSTSNWLSIDPSSIFSENCGY